MASKVESNMRHANGIQNSAGVKDSSNIAEEKKHPSFYNSEINQASSSYDEEVEEEEEEEEEEDIATKPTTPVITYTNFNYLNIFTVNK